MASKADAPVIPININATYKIFSKVIFTVGDPVDLTQYKGRKLTQDELQSAADKIYDTIKSIG